MRPHSSPPLLRFSDGLDPKFDDTTTVLPLMFVGPLYVFAPESVIVPAPLAVSVPPLMP